MAKKLFEENNTEATVETEPAVKQMTRTISSITNADHDSVYEVDRELTEWLKKGYKLMTAQIIGNDQQGVSVYYLPVTCYPVGCPHQCQKLLPSICARW